MAAYKESRVNMKTANSNFIKRNRVSALLTASIIMSITAADVMSTPLSISAVIQEVVTPTFYNPSSHCATPLEGAITGTGISSPPWEGFHFRLMTVLPLSRTFSRTTFLSADT